MGEQFTQLNDWERTRIMVMKAEHLRRTLTSDRGKEIAGHKTITASLNLDVYSA